MRSSGGIEGGILAYQPRDFFLLLGEAVRADDALEIRLPTVADVDAMIATV
jgi:hypothetical protein